MSDAAAILASSTLLIDEYLPRFDTTRREHLVVRGEPAAVLDEARNLDLLSLHGEPSAVLEEVRNLDLLSLHSPLLDTVMWVRTLPEKMGRKEPADVPSMRLGDLFDEAAESTADQPWVGLGERKGRELVIGVVGKFWQPSISWNTVPAESFRVVRRTRLGKDRSVDLRSAVRHRPDTGHLRGPHTHHRPAEQAEIRNLLAGGVAIRRRRHAVAAHCGVTSDGRAGTVHEFVTTTPIRIDPWIHHDGGPARIGLGLVRVPGRDPHRSAPSRPYGNIRPCS